MAKLTPEDMIQIRNRVLNGESKRTIAKDMGISEGYIYLLMKNNNSKTSHGSLNKKTPPPPTQSLDSDSIKTDLNETIVRIREDLNVAKIIIGSIEIERWKAQHKNGE